MYLSSTDSSPVGVYIEGRPSSKLTATVKRLLPKATRCVIRAGYPATSCTANAQVWAELLSAEGWPTEVVIDGVAALDREIWHEDSEEYRDAVGHDWVLVRDAGRWRILDGSVDQFEGQVPTYVAS